MADNSAAIIDQVRAAGAAHAPLNLRGRGSKEFYGRVPSGAPLELAGHSGVLLYDPADLVITARAGTTLAELDQVLAEKGQVLGFEPPRFGEAGSTLGGAIASGLSGPRRPWAGAARDFVLGVRVLNSKGESLKFGGTVIKNVAGYDISRLMAGALGTLGPLLEVSLRVMPALQGEQTRVLEMDATRALVFMNRSAGQPLPLSAALWEGESGGSGRVYLRFSGSTGGVAAAGEEVGGERLSDAERFWASVRDHRQGFFQTDLPLWRISQAPAKRIPELPGDWLLDWGGGLRWLKTRAAPDEVFALTAKAGGHATLFRGGDRQGQIFQPLAPTLGTLHRRLKQQLDAAGIFNPGRMYQEL